MERHNYFIYAYTNTHGGLHGMYDYVAIENCLEEDAIETGREMSYEVFDSYNLAEELYPYSEYEEECRRDGDTPTEGEYWDIIDDLMDDECAYEIYILKDDVDVNFINNLYEDPHDIIEKYCVLE